MQSQHSPFPKAVQILIPLNAAALMLGLTPKALRRRVERRIVPFRKQGKKLFFLADELRDYLETLPGLTLAEARENARLRRDQE